MTEFIMQYWLEVLFSIIILAFGGLFKWLYGQFKAVKLGMQAMLRDRIVQAYYHYFERGWITLHGLENIEKMYTEYHNLGGNGAVTKLVEDLREIPVKEENIK